jgi:hypothetical protein
VPIKQLTPTVRVYELGILQLWQEDLAEIVRLVRQLPNVDVRIESEHFELAEAEDLVEIGQRLKIQKVSNFTVLATRPSGDAGQEIMSVKLGGDKSVIAATEPDLTMVGLIEGILEVIARRRRLSLRGLAFAAAAAAVLTMFGSAGYWASHTPHGWHLLGHVEPAVPGLVWAVVLILATVSGICAFAGRKTLLHIATQREAPTFWQRKRADIIITVVVAAAFYLLGLLTAHL